MTPKWGRATTQANPKDSPASVHPAKRDPAELQITALTTTNAPPILR